jgi:hypothetical protein
MDFITTKQNKLPSFIDRCLFYISIANPIVFVKSHVKVKETTPNMRKSARHSKKSMLISSFLIKSNFF